MVVREIAGSRAAWIASAVVVVAVVAGVGWWTLGGSAEGGGSTALACASGTVVSTTVDHDDSTDEERSPQEQARAWASVAKPEAVGEPRVAYRTDDRVQLTMADADGRTVAVLTYEKSRLGWFAGTIESCG